MIIQYKLLNLHIMLWINRTHLANCWICKRREKKRKEKKKKRKELHTRRSVPCSAIIREASSYSRWEQIQRPTARQCTVRDLETLSPKRAVYQIPLLCGLRPEATVAAYCASSLLREVHSPCLRRLSAAPPWWEGLGTRAEAGLCPAGLVILSFLSSFSAFRSIRSPLQD